MLKEALNKHIIMTIEEISKKNVSQLIDLVVELWADCSYDEEFENYKSIIGSDKEVCFLAKFSNEYIAFIHINIRNDYVEGASQLPIAYIEGVYVKQSYQRNGVAKQLMKSAENWATQKKLIQIASDTVLQNTAGRQFHINVGFTEVERLICYIKNV